MKEKKLYLKTALHCFDDDDDDKYWKVVSDLERILCRVLQGSMDRCNDHCIITEKLLKTALKPYDKLKLTLRPLMVWQSYKTTKYYNGPSLKSNFVEFTGKCRSNDERLEHIVKRRKCWLPAFPTFPIMFSSGCFSWQISQYPVVKGYRKFYFETTIIVKHILHDQLSNEIL